ncbi:MAG: hypothetical protein KUL77_00990 [Thermomonas sp.]|uniref:hypothetical protein n=1 Tax=Thermomonas sp. TaxID=1971895 RepID=UPI001ED3CA78|nr:hypothetical protein [Thermomonas sp.]MBV2208125.1 hypothetical protein [Thermomonas sp.]
MKATIVGLVTPHVFRVIDLAKQAEAGVNVDWHLRDTVASSINELAPQYNADDLKAAYIHGLEAAAKEAEWTRKAYIGALQSAVALAKKA